MKPQQLNPNTCHHDTRVSNVIDTATLPDIEQTATALDSFAPRILHWFDHNGRHDLPWQQHKLDVPNPYPVWLSEVMLQQTQVATVIPYFVRFMNSFPTVQDLAAADWSHVAEHWAGLGYYARARNLHKGAKQLVEIIERTGDFPQSVAEWEHIAGVGQSTAGAIVAMGVRGYGAICDGNVKRVLTRWAGIDGDITKAATNRRLWQLAERLTPFEQSGHYAQAMMDMGATLCTKAKPACLLCPVQSDCIANAQGRQTDYPVKRKKAPNPTKYSLALRLQDEQSRQLWLQRPDTGIWGGLYCLPLAFLAKTQANNVVQHDQQDAVFEQEYNTAEQIVFELLQSQGLVDFDQIDIDRDFADNSQPVVKHGLTHFHWLLRLLPVTLNPTQVQLLTEQLKQAEQRYQWLAPAQVDTLARPKAMHLLAALP